MSQVLGWSRSAADIVVEIEMIKTNWAGQFLLVEGPSDECFFGPRISGGAQIVQCSGKRNVEDAFALLDADANHKNTIALGVVDEDYDWLTGHFVQSANILKFDPRDLESMLIRSGALQSVLAEFAERDSVRTFESSGLSVLEALAERAEIFGRIRMYNSLHAKVCLKKFKPVQFCEVATWTYDRNRILAAAVARGVHNDAAVLDQEINRLQAPSIWHVVRGHDLVDILVGGLLGVLGGGSGVRLPDVERVLRQSLQAIELNQTPFIRRLLHWQSARGVFIY